MSVAQSSLEFTLDFGPTFNVTCFSRFVVPQAKKFAHDARIALMMHMRTLDELIVI